MMSRIRSTLLLSVVLWALAGQSSAAHADCVDVALVLTVDSSASVSAEEFALQQNGIAGAFRSPEVQDAVRMAGRVAVSIIIWGSEGQVRPQSGWMLLDGEEGAEAFARTVETMPRVVGGDTGLGAGLLAAVEKFGTLDFCAIRKVVNVSGDGQDTMLYRRKRQSPAPVQVREMATAGDIEINALAISNEEPNLAQYYAGNVITGPAAFVMEARNYQQFAEALRRKLIREIGPRLISDAPHAPGPVLR